LIFLLSLLCFCRIIFFLVIIDKILIILKWTLICLLSLWSLFRLLFGFCFVLVKFIFSFDASTLIMIHFTNWMRWCYPFCICLLSWYKFISVPPIYHFNILIFLVDIIKNVFRVNRFCIDRRIYLWHRLWIVQLIHFCFDDSSVTIDSCSCQ